MAMTRARKREASHCDIPCNEANRARSTCNLFDKNARVFCEECCGFFMSFWHWMQTLMSEIRTPSKKICRLNLECVTYQLWISEVLTMFVQLVIVEVT